jgi:hypothetical protein
LVAGGFPSQLFSRESQSIEALLVEIAPTRLSQAGLAVSREHLAKNPEFALYDRLQAEQEDAYGYYNALLKRLDSFCNALESLMLEKLH